MRVSLAQIFDVLGQYVPTKASLYLKRVGANSNSAFDLSSGEVIVDASNFQNITAGSNNLILDTISGYTGNGSMTSVGSGSTNGAFLNYPVSTDSPGRYTAALRIYSLGHISVDVLINGLVVGSITSNVSVGWHFVSAHFVLPDTNIYQLGFRVKENGGSLDKICITVNDTTFVDPGPDYDPSPFVTIHLQVFNVNGQTPTTPLDIYAYKTTLDEVVVDDWYNFAINLFQGSNSFTGSYALVLSATGSQESNFIIWEMMDNDEYLILPSAIKVDNA